MATLNEALLNKIRERDPEVPVGAGFPLKPCPFCGGRAYLFAHQTKEIDGTNGETRQDQKTWFVTPYCASDCIMLLMHRAAFRREGAQWTNDGLRYETRQEAIDAWNRRAKEE